MLKSIIAIAALAAAGSASATTVLFSDDFESDTPALGITTTLNKWVVNGNVDVVGMPNGFGITCAGGCVDLDGTTGPGRITSAMIAFAANLPVTISYDLSGSQRSSATDAFAFFVSFPHPYIAATDITWNQPGSPSASYTWASQWSGQAFFADINGTMPWTTFTFAFTPTTAATMQIGFMTQSADNIGPLIDNVLISQVPEPATWAMLIAGFGLVGTAMRRRRTLSAA